MAVKTFVELRKTQEAIALSCCNTLLLFKTLKKLQEISNNL